MGPFRGLINGFLAPFRGGLYVARQRLWRYLLLPIVVNLALAVGALWAAAIYWHQELSQSLTTSPVLGWIFLVVATTLGGVVLFIVLQPVLGAVFNDRLSEKVEVKMRGSAPSAPFFASTGRALVHGLLKLLFYATALTLGLVLTALTGVGSLVGVGLGVIFLAYDGFDYPLARRGFGFGAKWGYLARHPALTVGYGLGTTLLYLVPLAFVVAPPFAAVGATLAFLDDDARDQTRQKAKELAREKAAEKAAEKARQKADQKANEKVKEKATQPATEQVEKAPAAVAASPEKTR